MPSLISDDKWIRKVDGAKMRISVYKTDGGIYQDMFINGDRAMHTFSERPYKLGQGCDGTIDSCVYSLLFAYCKAKKLDLIKIYHEAYPKEKLTKNCLYRMVSDGWKQGVEFPKTWNKAAFSGLLRSLSEINNHSLEGLLQEKYEN